MGEMYRTVPAVVAPAANRILPPPAAPAADPASDRSVGMEGIRRLLDTARDAGLAAGRFRGLLHIAIGRTVSDGAGAVLSRGLTWREAAAVLKELRYDRELVREFGADPDSLSPRDRERFWYSAIALARVDSAEASAQADLLTPLLRPHGFVVAPSATAPRVTKPAPRPPEPPAEKPKRKKK
ncbi:hypothetical protein [Urbifossiella limnaea]|uniref:Uncharacterized protein n=1 Tax=Urbifossiella limnaea TaxID=2528023 RepID=A0A517XV96_9BACT|nr:hypothetical protein [Urbifossiella limnaea]QDU21433.1 hypothetical protein ETAA1_34000 [Urbifossiella limnaea]